MNGYKNITKKELMGILNEVKDGTVSLNITNFVSGTVVFDKFDCGIYKNNNGENILALTSEEMENCWDLNLDEVKEILIDEDIEEYTYEELEGNMVILKYNNDIVVMIEF